MGSSVSSTTSDWTSRQRSACSHQSDDCMTSGSSLCSLARGLMSLTDELRLQVRTSCLLNCPNALSFVGIRRSAVCQPMEDSGRRGSYHSDDVTPHSACCQSKSRRTKESGPHFHPPPPNLGNSDPAKMQRRNRCTHTTHQLVNL